MKKYVTVFILLLMMLVLKLYFTKINVEKYTNKNVNNKNVDESNLLTIANFQIEPYNYFSDIRNPINSSKVLVQSAIENFNDVSKDAYYKIRKTVDIKRDYKLSSWYSLSDDWDGTDNIFNVQMNNNKLSSHGSINKELDIDGLKWYHSEFIFKPTSKLIDIFLGYKPKNTKGKRYIANLKLDQHITNLNDFSDSDDLVLFLDANNPISYNDVNTYKKYWINIINENTMFKWEKEPNWNKKGYFILNDIKGTGLTPLDINLNNDEFTVSVLCSSIGGDGNGELLCIPGNQGQAFVINMPNSYGSIICDIADTKYTITNQILVENINLYTFAYKNNTMTVYVNDILVQEFKNTDNIYFNKDPILINQYRNCKVNLYSVLIYNKKLDMLTVKKINNYFHKKLLDNSIVNLPENSKNSIENFKNIEHFDSNNGNDSFIDNSIENNKTVNNDRNDNLENEFLNENEFNKCPKIIKTNDEYELDVSKSNWSKSSGVNVMKYKSKDQCLNDYSKFYPNCDKDSLFDKEMDKINKCIFTGEHTNNASEHPCQKCPELDGHDYKTDVELTQDCKHSINSYCYNQLNKKKEDMDFKNCKCFLPEFAFTQECQNPLLELHNKQIHYDSIG